jgi:4-hydroxy-tetrahydrodipicolinate synthase
MATPLLSGVFAAALTPLDDDGRCDTRHLAAHCRMLIDEGCHGVSLFGTTGEGPAFTTQERREGLEAVLASGIATANVLPGTGCASISDTIELTRHALECGCRNILLMPPFFFKNVSDDGVFGFYSDVVKSIGSDDFRIYIYNFPDVTGVWIRPDVVRRLMAEHPGTIAGVKDSSGDWDYVNAVLEIPGLAVFTGWEPLVPALLAAGGCGNISGLANVIPAILRRLFDERPQDPADPILSSVNRLVAEFKDLPVTPGIKALAANLRKWPAWRNMRPPLVPLDMASERKLLAAFGSITGGIDKAVA